MLSKSLLALAALATCCYAQAPAIASMDSIAKDTADLAVLVKRFSSEKMSSDVEETLTNQYRNIINEEGAVASENDPAPKLTASEQEKLCNSQGKATDEHVALLDGLVAKHDTFSSSFMPVIQQLLRLDESATDKMAFVLRDMAPDCKPAALDELSTKFQTAIDKYE